jgi:hypothetical protein
MQHPDASAEQRLPLTRHLAALKAACCSRKGIKAPHFPAVVVFL